MAAIAPPCEGRLTADKKGPIPLPDDDDSKYFPHVKKYEYEAWFILSSFKGFDPLKMATNALNTITEKLPFKLPWKWSSNITVSRGKVFDMKRCTIIEYLLDHSTEKHLSHACKDLFVRFRLFSCSYSTFAQVSILIFMRPNKIERNPSTEYEITWNYVIEYGIGSSKSDSESSMKIEYPRSL